MLKWDFLPNSLVVCDQEADELCVKPRGPGEPIQAAVAWDQAASGSAAWPGTGAHAALQVRAGSPRPGPTAVITSGAGRELNAGSGSHLGGRTLPSLPSPLHFGSFVISETIEPGAQGLMKTPVCAHGLLWGSRCSRKRLHLPGQRRGSYSGPVVGRAELANDPFWGLEVSPSVLFLI